MTEPTIKTRPRDPLFDAIESLRHAQVRYAVDRPQQWANAVDSALARVADGLQRRLAARFAPEGPLTPVDPTRPTLARQADELGKDEAMDVQRARALQEKVKPLAAKAPTRAKSPSADQPQALNVAAIHDEVDRFLAEVQQVKETESKLVHESVNTEIGGEA